MSEGERPRLGRPVEVARAEILASPEARELAKTFGVSIEVYADMVLEYALNPAKEPQLELVDEEEALEEGVPFHTPGEVRAWAERAAEGRFSRPPPAPPRDAFSTEPARPAGVASPALTAPSEADGRGEIKAPLGSVLRGQLLAQRTRAMSSTGPAGSTKPKK